MRTCDHCDQEFDDELDDDWTYHSEEGVASCGACARAWWAYNGYKYPATIRKVTQ